MAEPIKCCLCPRNASTRVDGVSPLCPVCYIKHKERASGGAGVKSETCCGNEKPGQLKSHVPAKAWQLAAWAMEEESDAEVEKMLRGVHGIDDEVLSLIMKVRAAVRLNPDNFPLVGGPLNGTPHA